MLSLICFRTGSTLSIFLHDKIFWFKRRKSYDYERYKWLVKYYALIKYILSKYTKCFLKSFPYAGNKDTNYTNKTFIKYLI